MNASKLDIELSRIFTVIDGPSRAYFEMPTKLADGQLWVSRYVYSTVNVAMVGEPSDTESVLCGWAYTRLKALTTIEQREDMAVLIFWRHRPQIVEFTDEQGQICSALRMRLVIPGIDLSELEVKEGERVKWL